MQTTAITVTFKWEVVHLPAGVFVREHMLAWGCFDYGPCKDERHAEALIAERMQIAQMLPMCWRCLGRQPVAALPPDDLDDLPG